MWEAIRNITMSTSGNQAAEKLREMITTPGKLVVAPGVYDGISARAALSQGFEALYMVSPP